MSREEDQTIPRPSSSLSARSRWSDYASPKWNYIWMFRFNQLHRHRGVAP